MYLIEKFHRGWYHTHTGRFHHWVGYIWGNYFFPGFKAEFYEEKNFTSVVNEEEFENEEFEETDREAGVLYRVDVDRQAIRNATVSPTAPSVLLETIFREMDDPNTIWGQVNDTTKKMLRAMRQGATQKEAAASAGIGERQGIRLIKQMRELVRPDNCSKEVTLELQACASKFEPMFTVSEVAAILAVSDDTVLKQFAGLDGVIDIGTPSTMRRRRKRILRIPQRTLERYLSDKQVKIRRVA